MTLNSQVKKLVAPGAQLPSVLVERGSACRTRDDDDDDDDET